MKTSCGALFYTYDLDNNIGIVLGLEWGNWLPFKGCVEEGETEEQTAIREVREETCGLVCLTKINLEHSFTSKRKHYRMGLCCVPYNIIEDFSVLRNIEERDECKEKKTLKFFSLHNILEDRSVHGISKASVRYFWNTLCNKAQTRHVSGFTHREGFLFDGMTYLGNVTPIEQYTRKLSVAYDYAKLRYKSIQYKDNNYINDCHEPVIDELDEFHRYQINHGEPTSYVKCSEHRVKQRFFYKKRQDVGQQECWRAKLQIQPIKLLSKPIESVKCMPNNMINSELTNRFTELKME